ncbi:PLP-dependent aminotransferase family protein [Janibacter sp. GXQ6167]|uniref:MocR-like transcription factor YczR n=1 Tax=Janibacter sp. GXQ6167 TaxID=3240791 RepID=UPI003523C68E
MGRALSARKVATLVGDFPRSPAYLGLADGLRVLIGDGRIGLGVRLPSERELTQALDVSRTTVTRAYETLRDQGYAESRRGAGTFTRVPGGLSRAHDRSLLPASAGRDAIDLNCAAPSAPPGVSEAFQRAAEHLPAYLSGPAYFPMGEPGLQTRIAASYEARGLPTTPDQIMVTSGALSGAAIVAQAFAGAGLRALVESPTYPNATQAMTHAGARLVPFALDPHGWDLDAFEATVRQTAPRLAYLVPDFHNPTGHLMPDAQRERLAAILAAGRVVPVVDEAHQALALEPGLAEAMPAPFALFSKSAITLGSASKAYWGGLRLGWIRASSEMMPRLMRARISLDLGSPVMEQLALSELFDRAAEVLTANRERLRTNRDALVAAVRENLPSWDFLIPKGGLALWCELPQPVATATSALAEQLGVVVAPGPVFAVEGGLNRFLRIPWTAEPEALIEATRRLAAAWEQVNAAPDHTSTAKRSRVLIA